MKITISKDGVNFEIEGEEILKELFRDENKCLWELKRALDKLEAEEFNELLSSQFSSDAITPIIEELQPSDLKTNPALQFYPPKKRAFSLETDIKFSQIDEKSFDGGNKKFHEHDEVGQFNLLPKSGLDVDAFKDKFPSSDTKVPLPQKESKQAIVGKRKRKYNRKHKHNNITNKKHICAKCHKLFKPNGNRQRYCSPECGMKPKVSVISKPKIEIEKEPPIIPAVRPNNNGIFMDA
jgi:hypothetical protein